MRRSYHHILLFALMSCLVVACGHKSTTTAPAQAPTSSSADNQPAAAAAPAPAPAGGGLEGDWQGDSGSNMPIQFSVSNNQVTDVHANFAQKKGSCTASGSIGGEGPSPINNKTFTAHGIHDKFELTMTGTFTSPTEASGTIDWKTYTDICGEVDAQLKWTAKKGAMPPPEDE